MKKRKLKKKNFAIFILIVMCVFLSLGFGVYSLAKYVSQNSRKTLVIPKNFQFSSNYLKENNPSYNVYDLNNGIVIELYNSLNTNKSEIDVPYTVTVTNGTSDITNGTITTSENTDTIVITPTNRENPVTVNVTSAIYNYRLGATFNFEDAENAPYYTFVDKGNYSELTIKTSSYNISSLLVSWSSNYVPDNTNPLMENWTVLNGTLALSPNTEYILIFFENINESHIATSDIITNNRITLP